MTILAWLYLAGGAEMRAEPMSGMSRSPGFLLVAAMWATMMVAMMLPSAAPAILLYGRVHRQSAAAPSAPPTAAFLIGYLVCWIVFSLLAATVQLAVASPMSMAVENRTVSGILLIATGAYQLSPIKEICLRHCRSPAEFLSRHYRPGASGAVRLGLLHGTYCVGCCWLLMALLFVGGVMNLAWIAALTLLVAAEKLLPGGNWIARIAGLALICWGGAMLFA